MKYPFVKIVDNDSLDGFAGRANGPFVRIIKRSKDDKGLLAHELVHVKQWFLTLGLHSILNRFKFYRESAEVSAYQEQLKHASKSDYKRQLILFGGYLANRYDLDLTPKEAVKLLER